MLAARLGKALLERNQDMSRQYERMHKELTDKLEVRPARSAPQGPRSGPRSPGAPGSLPFPDQPGRGRDRDERVETPPPRPGVLPSPLPGCREGLRTGCEPRSGGPGVLLCPTSQPGGETCTVQGSWQKCRVSYMDTEAWSVLNPPA